MKYLIVPILAGVLLVVVVWSALFSAPGAETESRIRAVEFGPAPD